MSEITLRDYFAAHAPDVIPCWFEPVMDSERPKLVCEDEDGLLVERDQVGYDSWGGTEIVVNAEALAEWDKDFAAKKFIQWRWFYADAMLEASGVAK